MNLNPNDINPIKKTDIENVEREQKEYFLLGQFMHKRGLKLFSYNSMKNEFKEVEMQFKEVPEVVFLENGDYYLKGAKEYKVDVDSRNIYFESLSLKFAENRLKKFKEGRIKDLCNLREVPKEKLSIYL